MHQISNSVKDRPTFKMESSYYLVNFTIRKITYKIKQLKACFDDNTLKIQCAIVEYKSHMDCKEVVSRSRDNLTWKFVQLSWELSILPLISDELLNSQWTIYLGILEILYTLFESLQISRKE